MALSASFCWNAWTKPRKCLIIRESVLLSELHPDGDGIVTFRDRLLGCERGAAIRQWLCRNAHLVLSVPVVLTILSWLVDWPAEKVGLARNKTAQAAADLALTCSYVLLIVAMLLSSRICVAKKVLHGKPIAWYYLFCCTLAWTLMRVWRGAHEAWPWWTKTTALMSLSASMLFIDALPVKTHAMFGRVGLTLSSVVAGATYIWLQACMADVYSEYDPPEMRNVAGFVTISTYQKCTDFLFFQVRTPYIAHM